MATKWAFYCILALSVVTWGHQEHDDAATISKDTSALETLHLDFNTEAAAADAKLHLSQVQANTSASAELKHISISGYASLLNLTQLNDVIHRLSQSLDTFHYDLNIPLPLETIKIIEQSHPACRIHYNIPFTYWDSYDSHVPDVQNGLEPYHRQRHKLRKGILGSPNLYSLTARLEYSHEDNFEDLELVYDILTSCVNIRELDLSFERHGCMVASYPYAFDFTKDEKPFPPLEVLKLSRYELDTPIDGKRRWPSLPLSAQWDGSWVGDFLEFFEQAPNSLKLYWTKFQTAMGWASTLEIEGVPEDNFQVWLKRMDWSQVRHLELRNLHCALPDVFDRLSPVLKNLEQLGLDSSGCANADGLPAFITKLNSSRPLKHLTLTNVHLSNHSALLSALSSSAPEVSTLKMNLQHGFLTEQQLLKLAGDLPLMSNLGIEIPRHASNISNRNTWSVDYAAMRAAALQPHLTALEFFVESPESYELRSKARDHGREDGWQWSRNEGEPFSQDPSFNRSTVIGLFAEYNKLRRDHGLHELPKLTIVVGLWFERNDDWGMLGPPERLIGHWVCESVFENNSGTCIGGNERMGGYAYIPLDDVYSTDWGWSDGEHKSSRGIFEGIAIGV